MPDQSAAIRTADGRRVTYLDRGPRNGRPVMYLHGMPGSRYEQLLFSGHALTRAGLRLVSVDRPGWGRTDPLAGDRVARSQDVLAVADHLGIDRFAVIAVSAGGSYALALAATSARVCRVLLVSAQMPYDDEVALAGLRADQASLVPAARLGRSEALIAGCEAYRAELLDDPYARFSLSLDTLSTKERAFFDQPAIRRLLVKDLAEGVRLSAEGLIEDLVSWPHPLEVDPSRISCAVTAVHGTHDDWEPLANLRRVLSLIPTTDLWLCQDTNHFGPLLRASAVLELLNEDDRQS